MRCPRGMGDSVCAYYERSVSLISGPPEASRIYVSQWRGELKGFLLTRFQKLKIKGLSFLKIWPRMVFQQWVSTYI